MHRPRLLGIRSLIPLVLLALLAAAPVAAEGQWTTIFFKRTFTGTTQVNDTNGAGTTLRMPITVPVKAEKIRVWLRADHDKPSTFYRLGLIQAADPKSPAADSPIPLLFDKAPAFKIETDQTSVPSDITAAPIAPGRWYLESYYTSDTCPYTNDADGGVAMKSELTAKSAPRFYQVKGVYIGNVYRVDVFSEAPPPGIICYGDSLTQGYQITPLSGNRYPETLGRLLNRPVLNLGVNSDLLVNTGLMSQTIKRVQGANQLVFLMGTNDIITGQIKDLSTFRKNIGPVITAMKQSGKYAVYIGTLPPAGGAWSFDKDPAKETLRQEINRWIREKARPDGVIDFDAALRDPENPARMRADYHCGDWIHPSDAGAQKMAEAAASILKASPQP